MTYLWAWCALLAGAALTSRFVPFREGGSWHLWPTLLTAAIALVVVAASLYVVILLEVLKLRRLRALDGRPSRRGPQAAQCVSEIGRVEGCSPRPDAAVPNHGRCPLGRADESERPVAGLPSGSIRRAPTPRYGT